MAISEYDAFGPWIYEIDEDHPVPRLFAPYMDQDGPARLLLKIPRNIERRVATPDMDLYDHVVGAYETYICVLTRREDQVERLTIPYGEIEGFCLTRHFLRGLLTLYLRGGKAEIPFNTVSIREMRRFTTLIRDRIEGEVPALDPLRERQMDLELDVLFVNMLKDLRAEGETPLLYGYQPMAARVPLDRSGLRGLLTRFRQERLPAALHVVTPRELIVIQRDISPDKREKEGFIYHYTYLPLANIRGLSVDSGTAYAERVCSVTLSEHTFRYGVRPENQSVPTLYAQLDEALSGSVSKKDFSTR